MDDHKDPWQEIIRFKFTCKLMRFAEEKISIHYQLIQDANVTKGEFINTDKSLSRR